jgi:hypothetical protein
MLLSIEGIVPNLNSKLARGTGESGPFGVIVGNRLVQAVTKALPDSRGYAAQVRFSAKSEDAC